MCRWKWASGLAAAFAAPALASWVTLASDVLGKPVVGKDGAALGRVQDLVLDVRNSPVSHVIVGFDGWGNVAEKLFPVATKSLGSRGRPELSPQAPLPQYVRATVLHLLFDYDETLGLDQPDGGRP